MYSKSLDRAPRNGREKLLYKATVMVFMAQSLLGMVQPLQAQEAVPNHEPAAALTTPEVATKNITAVITCEGEGETRTCFFYDEFGNPLEGTLVPVSFRMDKAGNTLLVISHGTQTIPLQKEGISSDRVPRHFVIQPNNSNLKITSVESPAIVTITSADSDSPLEIWREMQLSNGSLGYFHDQESVGLFYDGGEYGAFPLDVHITTDGISFYGEPGQTQASLERLQFIPEVVSASGDLVIQPPIPLGELATFTPVPVGGLNQFHVAIPFSLVEEKTRGAMACFRLSDQQDGTQVFHAPMRSGKWLRETLNEGDTPENGLGFCNKESILNAIWSFMQFQSVR